jgi:MarR family transcriptional regulator for hemolysin
MPRSSAAPPQVDLSYLLNQASYALTAQLGAALEEIGITVREYCVLWKADEAERSQSAIAELAGLDKTTMVVTRGTPSGGSPPPTGARGWWR